MSSSPVLGNRWLFGPFVDLLLGCGLLYVVLCFFFVVQGGAIFRGIPIVVPALLVALLSAPHYGATILRVYEQRTDRRRYFLFSVVATGLLLVLFGASLFHQYTGSILATVYLTWSGWHYTGQNYGIASMFLRRRGIEFDGVLRRFLYASFVLSYAIVFLVLHSQGAPKADPSLEIRLIPLALPEGLNAIAVPVLVAAYLGTSVVWIVGLSRRAERLSDLLPSILIAFTQALWWTVPYAARQFEWGTEWIPIGWDSRSLFFPWIASAHAIQYLWITSFYARASDGWAGQSRYYLGILAAGSAVWTLPALAFAPGAAAFDWNFALLLAATVNIHHFILDGVIWKLRHLKIARVLISNLDSEDDQVSRETKTIGARLVWAIAAVGLLLAGFSLVDAHWLGPKALRSGDLEKFSSSLDRQAWFGRTDSFDRYQLGRRFKQAGDFSSAIAQFELSAAREPRVESIKQLIALYQRTGNAQGLFDTCDRLFDLDAVERPMPTPAGLTPSGDLPLDFWQACFRGAKAARATKPMRVDRSGGAGQDGGIRGGAPYP